MKKNHDMFYVFSKEFIEKWKQFIAFERAEYDIKEFYVLDGLKDSILVLDLKTDQYVTLKVTPEIYEFFKKLDLDFIRH